MNTLQDIQNALRQHLPAVQQKYQVRQLGIFGSFVRGEQTDTSDVDLLVEFAPNARFGLLTFCQLENDLSELLQRQVDLVMKDGLKPRIGERILQEVIYLSMTPRQIEDYLHDMLDAIAAAQQFTAGMNFEKFEADQKTIFAVTRAIAQMPNDLFNSES